MINKHYRMFYIYQSKTMWNMLQITYVLCTVYNTYIYLMISIARKNVLYSRPKLENPYLPFPYILPKSI